MRKNENDERAKREGRGRTEGEGGERPVVVAVVRAAPLLALLQVAQQRELALARQHEREHVLGHRLAKHSTQPRQPERRHLLVHVNLACVRVCACGRACCVCGRACAVCAAYWLVRLFVAERSEEAVHAGPGRLHPPQVAGLGGGQVVEVGRHQGRVGHHDLALAQQRHELARFVGFVGWRGARGRRCVGDELQLERGFGRLTFSCRITSRS
jgi:hypothetical protein